MHLMTKYFGQIDYDPTEVLSFPNGIFGFEEEKQFLLLPFHGGGGNLLWHPFTCFCSHESFFSGSKLCSCSVR